MIVNLKIQMFLKYNFNSIDNNNIYFINLISYKYYFVYIYYKYYNRTKSYSYWHIE